ncbi:hypothetical protein [Oceanobacillus zhaokaii]|nr:hypothetical protein [Oceanobacillus zhaokaii]
MMWIRYVIIGFLSLTSVYLFYFQGIEMYHAFKDYFQSKHL